MKAALINRVHAPRKRINRPQFGLAVKRFATNQKGNAIIEFALAMPVLLLLSLGGFEVTRYLIIHQKLSKTVSTMADLVARSPSINNADMANMYNAVPHLMEPYALGADGVVIISDVGNIGSGATVNWQKKGGGTYSANSKIGTAGNPATLPSGFTLATNEDTIIAEIYYNYKPLVAPDVVANQIVYKVKFAKPRLGSLTIMNP